LEPVKDDRLLEEQLLEHWTVTVTVRYTHANLDTERSAVAKLEGLVGNLATSCTKMRQSTPKMSPIIPLKAVASYT
jgi:hypothetical protein